MFDSDFRAIVEHDPLPHQRDCWRHLSAGASVILRAPTGSGKSEAVWIPFLQLRGERFPMRMIHALPMRALANQLERRMQGYVEVSKLGGKDKIRVAAQHGKRPESVLFYADAIFATLDQVVSSYACAPLSLTVRHGNIPAGAIPGSFLIFDEIHTFEPQLGLQCILVLANRAKALGVPFVIMSATLPTNLVMALQSRFGAELVEVDEKHIGSRARRRVTMHIDRRLTPQAILNLAHRERQKVLVVVNTVGRAIELYDAVREHWDCPLILAHSRFYDDHRLSKEQQIEALFGKNSPSGRALLIATQVVEVGLDISAELLLTELAPMDALVQRAGRCARWGGCGEVWVFTNLETKKPYDDNLIDAAEAALTEEKADGDLLTWQFEKKLVDRADEISGRALEKFIEPEAAAKVLMTLAEAAFAGNPAKAESAVREGLTVEVALHNQPTSLEWDVFRLPRVRLHPTVFHGFVKKSQPRVWQATVKRNAADDYHAEALIKQWHHGDKLGGAAVYVIDSAFANYNEQYGLRLGIAGAPAAPDRSRERAKLAMNSEEKPEPWQEHIARVVQSFEEHIRPKEGRALANLARWLDTSEEELITIMKLVLIFHDLGKLTRAWQEKIQRGLVLPPRSFLAHRGGRKIRDLPPHATVSAWVASPLLLRIADRKPEWEVTLAVPALSAIAHHHCVGSDNTPRFQMQDGWFELAAECCRTLAAVNVAKADFNTVSPTRDDVRCGAELDLLKGEAYTSYILFSRWLRLADRMASGDGEHGILHYEEWSGDV